MKAHQIDKNNTLECKACAARKRKRAERHKRITKIRRRKTLHYGRFKFTACNKQSKHRAQSRPRPSVNCRFDGSVGVHSVAKPPSGTVMSPMRQLLAFVERWTAIALRATGPTALCQSIGPAHQMACCLPSRSATGIHHAAACHFSPPPPKEEKGGAETASGARARWLQFVKNN